MSERSKVLNIIGCGRSGSTILGNTLGQMDGYVHVGELCYIWNRGIVQNALCGCGRVFRDCEFWDGVLRRSGLSVLEEDAARLSSFPRLANRRLVATIVRGRGPEALADGIDEYADALAALYRSVRSTSGCRVVVDSTKSPAHAYLLDAAEDVDLYVLHLVRDARAVTYSWNRKVLRRDQEPGSTVPMDRFSTARSALKWTYANLSVELLRKRLGRRMLTIRYEDFIADPRGTISSIVRLLGENDDTTPFISERMLRLEATHTVWGNPSRLRTGSVELRLDAEWERAMSARQRGLVTAMTWPLLRKYGYGRGGPVASSAGAPAMAGSR